MVPNASQLLELSQKLSVLNVLPEDLDKSELVIEFRCSKKTISRLNRDFFLLTHKEDEVCPDTDEIIVTSNGFHFRYVSDKEKEQESE